MEALSDNCWEVYTIDNLHYEYYDGYNRLKTVDDYADCLSELYITQLVSQSDTYSADQRVIANSLVHGNSNVTYQAGDEICLNGGFEVEVGTEFLAQTGVNCGSSPGVEGFKQNSNLDYLYDGNGNMIRDPNKGITVTYNHLDLATLVLFDDGKKIEMIYDASGTLLRKKQINASGSVIETRDYISGTEYIGSEIESVYHSEGRVFYDNEVPRYEYALQDHLGNTRVMYYKNGENLEVLAEFHYYPNGYKMNGPWANVPSNAISYQYNSIDHVDDFELNVNMATFRTLDPTLGKWWSVDPAAEALVGHSPYCSMNASPMMYSDPNGDLAFLAAAGIGAVAGIATNGVVNSIQGNNFFDGWGSAALGGALSAIGAPNAGIAIANAAGSTISSHLPSASVDFGGLIVGISPSVFFGDGGWGVGANVFANLQIGNVALGVSAGVTYGKSNFTGQTGLESRVSTAYGYNGKNFGLMISSSYFQSGQTSQRTGAISIRAGAFRFSYENDGEPLGRIGFGDNGDSYRSAAVTLGIGDFSLGLRIFTGYRDFSDGRGEKGTYVQNPEIQDYLASPLYVGYKNYRIGFNHYMFGHLFQNRLAHGLIKDQAWIPWKPNTGTYPNRPRPSSFYGGFFFSNPNTNW